MRLYIQVSWRCGIPHWEGEPGSVTSSVSSDGHKELHEGDEGRGKQGSSRDDANNPQAEVGILHSHLILMPIPCSSHAHGHGCALDHHGPQSLK